MVCAPAFGWGREGHETIAKIAENNLKPSVKKKIEKMTGLGVSYVNIHIEGISFEKAAEPAAAQAAE